jgi:hypothetical protein
MRQIIAQLLALSLTLSLGFCAAIPDQVPPDTGWQPTDVNNTNIVLMTLHRQDLVQGHGTPSVPGSLPSDAVQRLLIGRATALPAESEDGSPTPSPPAPNGAPNAGAQ